MKWDAAAWFVVALLAVGAAIMFLMAYIIRCAIARAQHRKMEYDLQHAHFLAQQKRVEEKLAEDRERHQRNIVVKLTDDKCSICNNDVRGWDCNHIPGMRYNNEGNLVDVRAAVIRAVDKLRPDDTFIHSDRVETGQLMPSIKMRKHDGIPKDEMIVIAFKCVTCGAQLQTGQCIYCGTVNVTRHKL